MVLFLGRIFSNDSLPHVVYLCFKSRVLQKASYRCGWTFEQTLDYGPIALRFTEPQGTSPICVFPRMLNARCANTLLLYEGLRFFKDKNRKVLNWEGFQQLIYSHERL